MASWVTDGDASSSRPSRAQWASCCAALRLYSAPAALAASKRLWSTPTRVDQSLFEAARAAGALYSRSAAQQLAHWARLGRELEASPSVTQDAIARVLAGQALYD